MAVEVEAECRTLAALKALLQDALPEVDVGTVRLEVGGRELADDDDVCGLEAGSVVGLSATAAALAAATLREEGWDVDLDTFRRAAFEGDVRRCGLYLDAGVACTPGEWSPLHHSVFCNEVEIVRLLLDRGAASDAKGPTDNTPLHVACSRNNVVLATLLLDDDAAIDEKDADGDTPLHVACKYNNVETATLLLDRGAAIDEKDASGATPLSSACLRNCHALVRLLLDRGAGNASTSSSPHGRRGVARKQLRGAAVDAEIQDIAQRSGDNEMVALLSRTRPAS